MPARGLLAGLFLLFASLAAFGVLVENLADEDIVHPDLEFADWLHDRARPRLTTFFENVTRLGNAAVLMTVTLGAALVLAWRRRIDDLRLVLLSLAGAELLTFALKLGFRRERPFFADPLATESTYSFPSGHAMVSLCVYGALAFVLARRLPNRAWQLVCFALAALVVLLIGFSRLYLGVHYLSDVLAGFSAGLAWLTICALALHLHFRWRGGHTSR